LPHQSSELSRFKTDPQVQSVLAETQQQLQPLNEDLAAESTAFNGIVYYGTERRHYGTANALLSLDAPDIATERNDFRRQNIDNHRVDLAATALGRTIRGQNGLFVASEMNTSNHMTWGHVSKIKDRVAGVTQFAFSVADGTLPSNRKMDAIWEKHASSIEDIAYALDSLASTTDSLGDSLELLPPTTPTAYLVRYDIVNSTEAATSDRYGALRSYQAKWDGELSKLVESYGSTLINEGDGHTIVIPLPPYTDVNSALDIRMFGTSHIKPLIEKMQLSHQELAALYSDLDPHIRLSIGLGHLEEDLHGKLTGPVMFEIGNMMKQAPHEPITYTEAAQKALLFNKKTSI